MTDSPFIIKYGTDHFKMPTIPLEWLKHQKSAEPDAFHSIISSTCQVLFRHPNVSSITKRDDIILLLEETYKSMKYMDGTSMEDFGKTIVRWLKINAR